MSIPSDDDDDVKRFLLDFSSTVRDLESQLVVRLREFVKQAEIPSGERDRVIRELYWHIPDVPVPLIIHSFECLQSFQRIVQNYFYPFNCSGCGGTIEIYVKDREDRDRFWSMDFYCERCVERRAAARDIEFQAAEVRREAVRIANLLALPYQEYLKTDHWQAMRKATLDRDRAACRICRSTDRLNVHHNTYERRGDEAPDDLITLCAACHQIFHDNGKLARPPE